MSVEKTKRITMRQPSVCRSTYGPVYTVTFQGGTTIIFLNYMKLFITWVYQSDCTLIDRIHEHNLRRMVTMFITKAVCIQQYSWYGLTHIVVKLSCFCIIEPPVSVEPICLCWKQCGSATFNAWAVDTTSHRAKSTGIPSTPVIKKVK